MSGTQTWKDKWISINSKFKTCESECITHYKSDQRCKDAIEAVVADIWNLKDWLREDSSAGVPQADIDVFLNTQTLNITACGDLETKQKHYNVKNLHREDTELIWVGNHHHKSGLPVVFSVTRKYKGSASEDHWEDAYELARRAIQEWEKFLRQRGLI